LWFSVPRMQLTSPFLLVALLPLVFGGLQCPLYTKPGWPGSDIPCPKISPKECKSGEVIQGTACMDLCKVCAKALGEPCGGSWNMHGRCGSGLTCQQRKPIQRAGICVPEKCGNVCGVWYPMDWKGPRFPTIGSCPKACPHCTFCGKEPKSYKPNSSKNLLKFRCSKLPTAPPTENEDNKTE